MSCTRKPELKDKIDIPPTKVRKLDEIDGGSEGVCDESISFGDFKLSRVINENSQRKSVCVEGTFAGKEGIAVVLLEKRPFNEQSINGILSSHSSLKQEFINDVYASYTCLPSVQFNGIKTTIIHPATEKHIKKYERQVLHIVEETPSYYQEITLPHIKSDQFGIQWVFNILDHKSETDRIVFEDPDPETGFILLPDLKWDTKQIEDLYLVAIVRKSGILSLRDLTSEHLPLLKNIKEKGTNVIKDKYKIPETQLRIYLHYQPSFYHLHVHFTNLQYDAPGIYAEKSHLLGEVVSNIELMSDYYQKATIPFAIKESDSLFQKYEEKNLLKRTAE
ncbi:m7GpppX diphosphatase [Schistocerca cancellata]|uniref:m7GpppX diphosphatase n=1 Tax=Schistocerca cancellata TaxID=274614 RepID=UPI00211885E7|nr:m7GpppX diphosphatase [Schistocerca cancellata]